MKFVILTGMSGAGKSTAIKMMEDIGYYCVDNLPIALLEKFVELSSLQENAELQKVAVGIDIRNGQALEEIRDVLARIKKRRFTTRFCFWMQRILYWSSATRRPEETIRCPAETGWTRALKKRESVWLF